MKKFLLVTLLFLSLLPLSAQNSSPVVTNIDAIDIENGQIQITWLLPSQTSKKAVTRFDIYRSKEPIVAAESLQTLVASVPGTFRTYIDTPEDSEEYFYAVISVLQNKTEKAESRIDYDESFKGESTKEEGEPYFLLLPGVNSTIKAARAAVKYKKPSTAQDKAEVHTYSQNELRESPLPYINLLENKRFYAKSTISKESKAIALSLLEGHDTPIERESLEPYIFIEDFAEPKEKDSNEKRNLHNIVNTSFKNASYKETIEMLKEFLSNYDSIFDTENDTINRAKFYLGEAYYFTDQYPEALRYFLDLQSIFPTLSRKWSQSTLDAYRLPKIK